MPNPEVSGGSVDAHEIPASGNEQPGQSDPQRNSRRIKSNVPLPRPLSLQGDLKQNWEIFHQMWENYEIITGLESEPDRYRIAHFMTAIGLDAVKIHTGLHSGMKRNERLPHNSKAMARVLQWPDKYHV